MRDDSRAAKPSDDEAFIAVEISESKSKMMRWGLPISATFAMVIALFNGGIAIETFALYFFITLACAVILHLTVVNELGARRFKFAMPPYPAVTVPDALGDKHFPVRRIFCIGRNYADHVREMGGDPSDTPPVFFTKPADAVVCPTAENPLVAYPPRTQDLHYEGELVLALKSGGRDIPQAEAMEHLYGVALGSDMTRRDLQHACKNAGTPWDVAKAFDQSAVLGPITAMETLPEGFTYEVFVNGQVRQRAELAKMIFSPAQIIAELSTYFELKAGDLVFTGTPEGVGAVVPGDKIEVKSPGLPTLAFEIK